jgi:Yip1 domain
MSQFDEQMPEHTPAYGRPEGVVEAQPQEEPARLGPVQRFIGALFSPGETFEDINRKPTWLVPALITAIITAGVVAFVMWRFQASFYDGIKKMLEQQATQSGRPAPTSQDVETAMMYTRIIGISISAVWVFIKYLCAAGALTLGMMFLTAQTTFKKILSVVFWSAAATTLVEMIVRVASIMTRPAEDINPNEPGLLSATNLAAFLPADTSSAVKAMASCLDIFSIWFLILLTIGLTAVSGSRKIKKGSVARMVFFLWIIFVLVYGGWAAIAPNPMARQ